jgi:hypothetical protein
LVVVRKVPIADELRKVIYVLKQGGARPIDNKAPTHQHPGELVWIDDENRFEVKSTSLEAFTGLLSSSRRVEPARVLIQLFAENKSENDFNMILAEQLKGRYARRLALTFTQFGLSDIGNTLQTAFGAGNPGGAFSLAIHAVDEWWLQAQTTRNSFQDLRVRVTSVGPSYQDFWWFEVEKAISPPRDNDAQSWHAVPGYLDFGMFCINLDAMIAYENKHYRFENESGKQLSVPQQRKRWLQLLNDVPRQWARKRKKSENGDEWFVVGATDSPNNVLDFAILLTGQQHRENLKRRAVFSFDASTRETCCCMFFEMAWAFGAAESFLADANANLLNRTATKEALIFLQFMVMEGLMPARSSSDSRNYNDEPVLFSRHWYSTLRRHQERTQKKGGRRSNTSLQRDARLIALPFMPTGQSSIDVTRSLLDDIAVRLEFWRKRALNYAACRGVPAEEAFKHAKEFPELCRELMMDLKWEDKLPKAVQAYQLSRDWLLSEAARERDPIDNTVVVNQMSADLDDLIELAAWTAYRLQLLVGKDECNDLKHRPRNPVGNVFYEASWVRHSLPDLQELLTHGFDAANVFATGYVCSGSWMYGVDKRSRESTIPAEVLAELTSLDNARRRAESGAGIPARKDFFHLDGEKPVKGMEYLKWRELLRYGGARSRRRDRVLDDPLCPEGNPNRVALTDPSALYSMIQSEVLACLRIADLYRQQYADTTNSKSREDAIRMVCNRAAGAVTAIYDCALQLVVPTEKK